MFCIFDGPTSGSATELIFVTHRIRRVLDFQSFQMTHGQWARSRVGLPTGFRAFGGSALNATDYTCRCFKFSPLHVASSGPGDNRAMHLPLCSAHPCVLPTILAIIWQQWRSSPSATSLTNGASQTKQPFLLGLCRTFEKGREKETAPHTCDRHRLHLRHSLNPTPLYICSL